MTAMNIPVADDSELIRLGQVRQMQATHGIERTLPLVLLDLHLPEGNPMAVVPQIKLDHPTVKVAMPPTMPRTTTAAIASWHLPTGSLTNSPYSSSC